MFMFTQPSNSKLTEESISQSKKIRDLFKEIQFYYF